MENKKDFKERYIKINGEKIAVTEEVYLEYMHPEWKESKRLEREKRCLGKNGNRCMKDCSQCKEQRTGSVISLDEFKKKGGEIADPIKTEALVEKKNLHEALHTALNQLEPENRRIAELFSVGLSEREIAAETGLSQRGINKRKQKIFAQLFELLKEYR